MPAVWAKWMDEIPALISPIRHVQTQQLTSMPKTYTVKQVADALGFSTNTVYKYLDEGKIEAVRFGDEGRFKIPESEMLRLIGETQTPTTTQAPDPISLNQVYTPDLFEWLLTTTGLLIGISLILFPIQYGQTSFSFSSTTVIAHAAIGLSSIIQLFTGILTPPHNRIVRLVRHIPLTASLLLLASISFAGNTHESLAYFSVLAFANLLSALSEKHSGEKFIVLIFSLLITAFLAYVSQPTYEFLFTNSQILLASENQFFALKILTGFVIYFCVLYFTYKRSKTLFTILSLVCGLLFLTAAINQLQFQSWDKTLIDIALCSFCILFPLQDKLDNFNHFSRRQVVGAFMWLILVVSGGIGLMAFVQINAKNAALAANTNQAASAKTTTENFVSESVKLLSATASESQLVTSLAASKTATPSGVAKTVFMASTKLRRVSLADKDGQIIDVYPPIETSIIPPVADREYFTTARQTGKIVITNILQPKIASLSPTIYIVTPIMGRDKTFLGVVIGALDNARLSSRLEQLDAGNETIFTVFDTNNAIVSTTNAEKSSVSVITETKTIDQTGWKVVAQRSYASAFKNSSPLALLIFIGSISAGLITLLATAFLTKKQS